MQATTIQQPIPARAPSPPVTVSITPDGPVITRGPGGADPSQVLEAFRQQRSELRNQLDRLESQRRDMSRQLQQPSLDDADQKGLQSRITALDARISAIDKAIGEADANVARAAAIPGAVVPDPPEPPRRGPPEEFYVLTGVLGVVVGFPLAIAYARRIWKRTSQAVAAIPQDLYDRFNRVDQAIDAVAVEVERIGEGQRFLTRVVADQQKAIGAGAAEPIPAAQRDAGRVNR